ncbi:MAG: PEP-CTERM sorting domain-containing protein [Armatimonadota bacterium]|nr:PEP-CTERM sorting domain-containing protein [Armatimonadota bacterium]
MRGRLIARALVALGALSVTLGLAQSQPVQLAFWNFNGGNTVPTGGIFAQDSSVVLVGGTAATFATGSPLDPGIPNSGYNTTNYPAQGTGNLTAGVQFNVPTTGYTGVVVMFDLRWSNTASRFVQFQYTVDRINWVNLGAPIEAPGGDAWWSSRNIINPYGDARIYISLPAAADNNPNFAFRVLATFAPNTNQYFGARDNNAAGYRPAGTLRFDLVEVRAVPEPASVIALGAGLAGLLGLRRRKR